MQHLPADLQAAVERTARPGADVSACADRGDNRPTACEVERLRGRRRALAHDQEPVFEASMDDLDQAVLDAVVERTHGIAPRIFGKADRMDVLVKLGAVAGIPRRAAGTFRRWRACWRPVSSRRSSSRASTSPSPHTVLIDLTESTHVYPSMSRSEIPSSLVWRGS